MICCGEKMRFTNEGYYVCDKCNNQVESELDLIKSTLQKHPGANAIDLVRLTGISNKTIIRFLNDGTLNSTKKIRNIHGYYCGNDLTDNNKSKWRSILFGSRKK